ncbi:MAG: hypothetical protein QN187_04560 [Armatimonadota bacterium]|nr:hypothetical protein [Armatimonadota bacterium]
MLGDVPGWDELRAYEAWWEAEGQATSDAIDRAGTPALRLFDRLGRRIDEVVYPPAYWQVLRRGYCAGAVWRAFEGSLVPAYLLGYVTSFYDPGVYCPHTVSLATAVALHTYGTRALKAAFLEPLLRRDETVWQGATWRRRPRGDRTSEPPSKQQPCRRAAGGGCGARSTSPATQAPRWRWWRRVHRGRPPACAGWPNGRGGAPRQRGPSVGNHRTGDLPDPRGAERLAGCQQRRQRRPGPAGAG